MCIDYRGLNLPQTQPSQVLHLVPDGQSVCLFASFPPGEGEELYVCYRESNGNVRGREIDIHIERERESVCERERERERE